MSLTLSSSTHFQSFPFEDVAVRIIDQNGDPWFVLADVCKALEISNPRDSASRLNDEDRIKVDLRGVDNTDGGNINDLGMGNVRGAKPRALPHFSLAPIRYRGLSTTCAAATRPCRAKPSTA